MRTNYLNYEELANRASELSINLKAEIVASLLSESGINPEKLQTNYTSSFNRSYRKDIYNAQVDKEKDIVNLFVSRNGFYDMLPEGLSHPEIVESNNSVTIKHLLSSYKKQKAEEANSRLFFKPFENHLFHFLIQIEKREKSLLNNSHEFKSFFKKFWDLSNQLEDCEFIFLLRILPYASKIKGNTNNIIQLLSYHIKKEITTKKSWIEIETTFDSKNKKYKLGQNFVIGNSSDQLPSLEFRINDVSDKELLSYSPGGYYHNFIELCFEFLLPIELEYTIKINPNFKQQKEGFGILGHSTVLQTLKN